MGMLIHHTWLEQQEKEEQKKPVKPAPAESEKEEPVKKTGGRPKKK